MRGGFLAVLIVLGLLNGSGPAGGSALAEGPGSRLCLVGSFSRVVGLSGAGMRDTPAAALLGGGGCPCVRWCVGVACCRGSGAVRPGCLTRLGLLVVGVLGWVWVGWL